MSESANNELPVEDAGASSDEAPRGALGRSLLGCSSALAALVGMAGAGAAGGLAGGLVYGAVLGGLVGVATGVVGAVVGAMLQVKLHGAAALVLGSAIFGAVFGTVGAFFASPVVGGTIGAGAYVLIVTINLLARRRGAMMHGEG